MIDSNQQIRMNGFAPRVVGRYICQAQPLLSSLPVPQISLVHSGVGSGMESVFAGLHSFYISDRSLLKLLRDGSVTRRYTSICRYLK